MLATIFVAVVILGVFAYDMVRRWWMQNEWKRRWRNGDDNE